MILKKILLVVLGVSLAGNVALGIRYMSRYLAGESFKQYGLIDKTQRLLPANSRFVSSLQNKLGQRNNYIVFVDSTQFYCTFKKLLYLDSLAAHHKATNFVVATSGDNKFISEYFKRYGLSLPHLIFKPHLNYLQSAICNALNTGIKTNGADFVMSCDGRILYNKITSKKNNKKELEIFLQQTDEAWQKTLN